VSWWTTLGAALERFFEQYGLAAIFVLIAVEEAGVPSPLPADLLVLLTAVQAREGRISLWQLLAVAEAATVVGASALYFLSRWAGRDLVYRYGRYVHATPARLDRVEARLRGAGVGTVALGRVFPGLRVLTAVACGVFEVPFRVFLPGMAIGGFAYVAFFALLGYTLGPPIIETLDALDLPLGSLMALGLVVLVLAVLLRARRDLPAEPPAPGPGRFRAGALAGLLASACAALVFNAMAGVVGAVLDLAPGALDPETVRRFAREEQRLVPLLLSLVALVALSALLGGAYGRWGERLARAVAPTDALRGLAFAVVPWALAVLTVPAAMDLSPAETAGLVLVQSAQHAAFGVVLGLAYPLLRAWLAMPGPPARAEAAARAPTRPPAG
jgi:membrane protein DedA with SNARE-associated domain